jgi:hypothetical protein
LFGKRSNRKELKLPPIAESDPEAAEILRVWATPKGSQQLTLRTTWRDAGAWGLLLVDIARHAAKAYEKEGKDQQAILARIHELFEAEWTNPSDKPEDITKP